MDWYPLINSLRIALISTFITFFLGIFAAYYIAKTPRALKGILDVVLTLPLVLPPTVIGFFILQMMGPKGPIGSIIYEWFDTKVVATWYSAIFATVIVTFPLMYRTVRGAFETFDVTLKHAGQTLGLSNSFIFWRIMMPGCKQGILAGTVLALHARSENMELLAWSQAIRPVELPRYPQPYISFGGPEMSPLAYKWVAINIAISFIVLITINLLERYEKERIKKRTIFIG